MHRFIRPLRLFYVGLSLVGLACTAGCGGCLQRDRVDNATEREAISIGVPQEPLGALIFVAHQKDFFTLAGLDVKVVDTYPSGKRALQGLLDGEVDLTISSEVPLVFHAFEREDFRVLATVGTSDNEPRIIARRDRGIATPEDFHGKRIATQRASAVHYFLQLFLLKHGIQDVEVEYLQAEELPQALADGKIDAFSMREPFINEARQLVGDNAMVFQEPGMYLKTMNLVALDRLVRDRPHVIQKVLRALERAETFFREQRDEGIEIAAKALNTDQEQLSSVLNDVDLELTLSHALIVALEDEARWAIDEAFTERQDVPDFQKLISADGIRAVKPAAVTVID